MPHDSKRGLASSVGTVLMIGTVMEHLHLCRRLGLDTQSRALVRVHSYQQTVGIDPSVAYTVMTIPSANHLAAVDRLKSLGHMELDTFNQLAAHLQIPTWE